MNRERLNIERARETEREVAWQKKYDKVCICDFFVLCLNWLRVSVGVNLASFIRCKAA